VIPPHDRHPRESGGPGEPAQRSPLDSRFRGNDDSGIANGREFPARAQALLDFWFGPPGDPGRETHRDIWFKSTPEHDATLRRLFLADHEQAACGALAAWEDSCDSALALLLLLDQIPRNIFRGTPRAYATDAAARAAADRAMEKGFDARVPPAWRKFFYMPLHHSESAADQRRSIALMQAVPNDPARADNVRYAGRYLEIIERFGRFPHRNAVLGRASTAEELAFLKEPESKLDLLKVSRPPADWAQGDPRLAETEPPVIFRTGFDWR
jgi:uncharacterized protein (DUF924 family)